MVKALFPIGKTQWAKWNDMQRTAFNTLMAQGKSFPDAVTLANSMIDVFEQFEPKKHMKKSAFDVIEDVVETVADVAEAPEANARFGTVEELMADLNDEPTLAPAPQKPAPKKPRTPAKKGK